MIIINNKAFFVKNETRNNTNTKKYNLLNNNFIFEATFRFIPNKKNIKNEYCIIARTGYNMGMFVQLPNAIKWCWWEIDDDNRFIYCDIYIDTININQKNKLKVIKNTDEFIVYLNDKLYLTKKIINKLYDYSEQTIFIGADNPYSIEENIHWFSGEIYEIKIYHDIIEADENLYLWYDFKNNSKFKTFDKSGNGNHGQLYESDEFKKEKNIEFNKYARPAKII